jgi:hypothetical protein
MRYATFSAIVFACSCAAAIAGGAAPAPHFQYRMGSAPRTQFNAGGRTYTVNPEARSTKQVRALKPEEFDPTIRNQRAETFYRTKLKDHYDEFQRHHGHDVGPFRAEFVELTRHWPAAERARWAWHNRAYIDGPLWTEWMADPAFASAIDALQRDNVVPEAGYLPTGIPKFLRWSYTTTSM